MAEFIGGGSLRLNKKGYMITPIIFITLFLIAIIFTLYFSKIDAQTAAGIRVSASVEKGITDVYKLQNEQINFAKLSAYECSEKYCFNSTTDTNATQIELCINNSLNTQYGNLSWSPDLANGTYIYLKFNLSSVNITNINMSSDREYVTIELNGNFFNKC